jgi:hypothetical protein
MKGQSVSRDVDVLRLLDKGAIIFDPATRTVEFLKSDMIASVARRATELDNRSFACKKWETGCQPAK